MNSRVLLIAPFTSLLLPLVSAQTQQPPPPEVPVPVAQAPANTNHQSLITPPAGENQRVYGPARANLIDPEAAKAIAAKFREAYGQDASPRIVVYVNRALVDTDAGLRLTGRTEKYENTTSSSKSDVEAPASAGTPSTQVNVSVNGQAGGTPAMTPGKGTASNETHKTAGENTYSVKDNAKPTLADQQTVRDVERLVGRVFRNAGARLADQTTAATLLQDHAEGRLTDVQSAREREALRQVADIVVEILISSRNLTVPGISGDATYTVPDIHATAIRLKDAQVVGQASASDILGRDAAAGQVVQRFDVRDITEATAIVLMEDMLTGTK